MKRDKDEIDRVRRAIQLLSEKGSFDALTSAEKVETLPYLGLALTLTQEHQKESPLSAEAVSLLEGVFCTAVLKMLFKLNAGPETLSLLAGFLLAIVYEFASQNAAELAEETLMVAEQRGRQLWAHRSSPT